MEIYIEIKLTRIVRPTGCSTVAVPGLESSNQRMTACIAVVSDDAKLHLLVILKGQPMRDIEKNDTIFFEMVWWAAANQNAGWINVEWNFGLKIFGTISYRTLQNFFFFRKIVFVASTWRPLSNYGRWISTLYFLVDIRVYSIHTTWA